MTKFIKSRLGKVGLPPGTLIHVGAKRTHPVKITIFDYDKTDIQEKTAASVEECFPCKDKRSVTWINVDGIHNIELIDKIGKHFQIGSLVLEDILNTGQRPKLEDLSDHLFIVLKMVQYDDQKKQPAVEQVSLVVGANFVISFQEMEGDVFDPIRDRLRHDKGRIRDMGADYLAYALIDTLVDHYFTVLENLGEQVEIMEEDVMGDPNPHAPKKIHRIKTDLMAVRKAVWPLREVVAALSRGELPLVKKSTLPYLRDVYDHTVQAVDTIESFRDLVSGLLDTYLSNVSNKTNEVMKVLTIMATIFIPLTFIAGIYGMNFKNMPELEWKWGYPVVWLIMTGVMAAMLVYFRRKKWL